MTPQAKMAKAVLLDRDGTIMRDAHYLKNARDVFLYKGVAESLRKLKTAGFKLIVVSNQSGIGRRIVAKKDVEAINRHLQKILWRAGRVRLDAFYYCPHTPQDHCPCRKPKTYLARLAQRRYNIDLRHSFVIGDKACDMLLAKRLKVWGLLVLTGYGKSEARELESSKSGKFKKFISFKKAAGWILKQN